MAQNLFSLRFMVAGAVVALLGSLPAARAQIVRAPLTEGFARTSSIDLSIKELLGTREDRAADEAILGPGYPALWIAEVQFKPIRLRRVELPDPKTGELRKEIVRYMVYRMILRDPLDIAGHSYVLNAERSIKEKGLAEKQPGDTQKIHAIRTDAGTKALTAYDELKRKLSDPEVDPAIDLDPAVSVPFQMPRFLLEATDRSGTVLQSRTDEVSVAVQDIVFQREMVRDPVASRFSGRRLLNSIEAISEIGEPVSAGDPDALRKAVYGVAVWRNVDPRADFFTITMSGFSNAYRISGAPENRVVEEKVVVQKFTRPGDEYEQDESEYRLVDEADTDADKKADTRYPLWTYREKLVQLNAPDLDSVLRNARRDPAETPEN